MAGTNTLNQDIIDGVYEFQYEEYNETAKIYESLYDVRTSDRAYEHDTDFVMNSNVEEVGEGEGNTDSIVIEGYTWYIKMITLQASIQISKRAVDDGRLKIKEWGSELAQEFIRYEETLAARVFNRGAWAAGDRVFNTQVKDVLSDQFGQLIYDETPLFNGSHPNKLGENTYSNYTASRTLTATNLETAANEFVEHCYDNMDNPIVIQPDTIVVPQGLAFTAARILNSDLMPNTSRNDDNVLKSYLNIVPWRYIGNATVGTTPWFIGKAKAGLRWYNRQGMEVTQSYDAKTRMHSIIMNKRIGIGVTNWRNWQANNLNSA